MRELDRLSARDEREKRKIVQDIASNVSIRHFEFDGGT